MREIGRADHATTEQLSALLDDRTEPEDRAFLADHVEDCPVCSHELADLRSVRTLLRSLPVYLPPRSFTIPVEAARPEPRFRRLIPLTRALSAVAAVLCVVLFAADAMQLDDRAAAPVPDGGAAFQITAARATLPPEKPALSAAESAKPAEAARAAPAAAAAKPAEAPKPAAAAARPAEEPKPAAPAAAAPADAAKSAFAPAATQIPATAQAQAGIRTIVPTPPAPTSGQPAQPAPAQPARSAAAPAAPAQNADAAASASAAAEGAAPAPPPPAVPGAPPQPASAAQAPASQAPGAAAGAAAKAPAAQGAQAAPTDRPALATATVPAVIRGEPGQAVAPPGPVTTRSSPWLSPVRLWALGLAVASVALLIGSFVLSRMARASTRAGGAR